VKLMEYQSRELLAEVGIPIPEAEVCDSGEEAAAAQARLGGMVVVKAQVLAGGRGKAGGIRIARSPDEARAAAERILGLEIGGQKVRKLLVVRAVKSLKEHYLSVSIDRGSRGLELVFSDKGGITIEEATVAHRDAIRRIPIDPFRGLEEGPFLAGIGADAPGEGFARRVYDIACSLFRLCAEKGCVLAEINPLSSIEGGGLVALDAKLVLDDSAVALRPELESYRNPEEYGEDEDEARGASLSYVGLEGNIGCMVNGAGLSMATMDLIKHYGGEPANFLDIGGSSNPDKVVAAFSILARKSGVKAILVNIFGGITRCDDVAKGIVQARSRIDIGVPTVIRLIGTNDAAAREILAAAGIEAYSDLGEAIQRVVAGAAGAGP
jgi:succinyl-CoA synthetase beta subunit